MTPDDFTDDFAAELERLARRPRPEDGVDEGWGRLRASTIESEISAIHGRGLTRTPGDGLGAALRRRVGKGLPHARLGRRRGMWYPAVGLAIACIGILAGWELGRMRLGHTRSLPMTTYATTNGQRANITLGDGSTVVLNVASRLMVPADYNAGNHVVHLDGEALFTAAHHSAAPLTVSAGGTQARVLGTSFTVRHYRTDTTVTVAVADGKVAVDGAVVTARRMMEVDRRGVVRAGAADSWRFAFATGILALPHLRLADAIPELNRWYNASIVLADPSLAEQPVSGNLPAGSLTDLENVLVLTLDVRVVRDGRTLTLYPVK